MLKIDFLDGSMRIKNEHCACIMLGSAHRGVSHHGGFAATGEKPNDQLVAAYVAAMKSCDLGNLKPPGYTGVNPPEMPEGLEQKLLAVAAEMPNPPEDMYERRRWYRRGEHPGWAAAVAKIKEKELWSEIQKFLAEIEEWKSRMISYNHARRLTDGPDKAAGISRDFD